MTEQSKNNIPAAFVLRGKEMQIWKNRAKEYVDNPAKAGGLLSKAAKKTEEAKNNDSLRKIWHNIHLLFSMVRDWVNGDYPMISKKAVATIIAGIIYFVSPIDLVPDWLIGAGLVDDAAVLGLIINQLDKEIKRYKEWKEVDVSENDPINT